MSDFGNPRCRTSNALLLFLFFAFCIFNLCAPSARATAPTKGLVGFWSFNEGKGTVAGDLSGHGNKGTITGATWVNGKLGKGLSFDASKWVTLPGPNLSTTYTISLWMKIDSFTGSWEMLMGQSGSNGLFIENSLKKLNLYPTTGVSNTALNTGQWYHVAAVVNAGAGTYYLNGNPDGTTSSVPAQNFAWMGNDQSNEHFYGTMDEVRIYNRALSQTEITALYQAGLTTIKAGANTTTTQNSGLVGYWPFEDGQGTTTADMSGHGNKGTITSATWINGKLGKALNFPGTSNNSVQFSFNASQINTPQTLTFTTWIKTSVSTGVENNIMQIGGDYNKWALYIDSADAGEPSLSLTGNYQNRIKATQNVKDGLWHFIVGTFDGTTQKIYVDGQMQNSSSISLLSQTGTQTSRIGANNDGSDLFNGSIDEARIYNRALSATEVQQLYQEGLAKINAPASYINSLNSGLVGYWTMDNQDTSWTSATTGTTRDKSGNNHTGTFTNMSQKTSPVPGKLGQALGFNGVSSSVTPGNVYNGVKTITFWVKNAGSSTKYLNGVLDDIRFYNRVLSPTEIKQLFSLGGGSRLPLSSATPTGNVMTLTAVPAIYIKFASGAVSTSITSPTIYVDGVVSGAVDSNWRFVAITTNTGINASDVIFGYINSGGAKP